MLVNHEVFSDERGFFMESWNQRDYTAAGISASFVQESHSGSRRGVLRGLHYQDLRAPLAKLVRCTIGRVFDVAVDLRVGSPTFARWFGVELDAVSKRELFIPVGFAHGFQAISEYAEVQYKQTGFWSPQSEGVLAWNDAEVDIEWPIENPMVSSRDQRGTSLDHYRRNPVFRYHDVSSPVATV